MIDGLANGQIAYYTKAHHSGVDGKAGIEIAKVFYDVTPQAREVRPPRPARAGSAYQLGVAELLQAALSNSLAQYVKLGKMLPQTAKAIGSTALQFVNTRSKAPRERSLGLKMAPKTIFNASITNQRSFGSLSVPLTELKTLGKQIGGTLNDVVMAMCSGALRSFLHERDLLPPKSLIALVPVSLREADDSSNNNQVSAIRVDLATDLADPARRFEAIRESSQASKELIGGLKSILGSDLPIAGSPWLMTGMASLYGRSNLGARLPRLANVAISNVPGPAVPLYMAGARMAHYYPVSIPYHGVGLNITVQSYAGEMEFGITACRRVLSQPEVQELAQHLRASLRELQRLVPAVVQETTLAATTGRHAAASGHAHGEEAPGHEARRPAQSLRRAGACRAQRSPTDPLKVCSSGQSPRPLGLPEFRGWRPCRSSSPHHPRRFSCPHKRSARSPATSSASTARSASSSLATYRAGVRRIVSGNNKRYAAVLDSRALPLVNEAVKASLVHVHDQVSGALGNGIVSAADRAEQAIDFVADGVNNGIQRIAAAVERVETALDTTVITTVGTLTMPAAQISLSIANRAVESTKRLSARVVGAEADVAEAAPITRRAVKKAVRRVKSRS